MGTFLKVIGILALCCVGGCIVLVVIGGMAAKHVADDPKFQNAVKELHAPSKITLATFNAVQTGMTYEQVKSIVGMDGVVQSTNSLPNGSGGQIVTTLYAWQDGLGGMNAMFQNGKLMQKSQFGLK